MLKTAVSEVKESSLMSNKCLLEISEIICPKRKTIRQFISSLLEVKFAKIKVFSHHPFQDHACVYFYTSGFKWFKFIAKITVFELFLNIPS